MIEFIRGDSVVLKFPIKDSNGNLIEMSDIADIILTCRKKPGKKYEVLFSKEKKDFRLEDGMYKVDLKAEDTENLNCTGTLTYDIEVTLKDGTRKSKIDELTLIEDVSIHGGGN